MEYVVIAIIGLVVFISGFGTGYGYLKDSLRSQGIELSKVKGNWIIRITDRYTFGK